MTDTDNPTDDDAPARLPGLFRIWELGQILKPGDDYRLEEAGETEDGAPLVAVYRRPAPRSEPDADHDGGPDADRQDVEAAR